MKSERSSSVQPLMVRIGKLFHEELALQNDFLRQENRILRGKFGARIPLTDADRRILVKYGLRIKDRLGEIISIVKPETLLAWNRRMKREKWTFDNTPKKSGRPRKSEDTEALILRLAEENATWGYWRIAGELEKLGHAASKSHVRDVLKRHGIPPTPNRKGLSWKQFIESHMDVIWAADFFTEEVWSLRGLVTCYVLFYIHLGTRRVRVAGCTPHPDAAWTTQQARNFFMMLDDSPELCRYLIHDRDSCFLPFDSVIASEKIRIIKTPPRTPKCNAFAERHVREIRETLDSLILLGEGHLRHVLKRIERHHNNQRPHQGLDNLIPLGSEYLDEPSALNEVKCESTLGGMLNHYYVERAA